MIKIAFSFDDGREDNYYVCKEILEPMNIKSSFNITVGYVTNDNSILELPSDNKPMSIDQVKELNNSPLFEISSHGYSHDNREDNLILGANELRKLLNRNDKIGIISPHSQFDLKNVTKFKNKCLENNVSYLRISHDFKNSKLLRKILRKVNRLIKNKKIFYHVYNDSFVKDNFLLNSVGIIKDNSLDEVKYFIDMAIKDNKNYIFMFHSILKKNDEFYNDLFTWDYDLFKELCLYLKELENKKLIEVCKVEELIEG